MTTRTLTRKRGRSQRSAALSGPSQIFGYVRVSTLQQAREGVSLAEQERQTPRSLLRNGRPEPN